MIDALAAEPSDADLMNSVRQGDRDAFAALIDRHQDSLVNGLARILGDRARAEDLAQESFLRLFRTAARYREEGRLRPYLFAIATNLARSEARRRRTWAILEPLFAASPRRSAAPEPSADARLLAEEAREVVALAIARLPFAIRAPLVLHEIEGLPYEDVAIACGVPLGTAKSRIARGRARLRELLQPYWYGEVTWTTTSV